MKLNGSGNKFHISFPHVEEYGSMWVKVQILKRSCTVSPSDTLVSIAHAVIFFATVGVIVFGLVQWNREKGTATEAEDRK